MKTPRLAAALLAAALLPFTSTGPAGAAEAAPAPATGSDLEMLAAIETEPGDGVLYRGRLYFSSRSQVAGRELWVTDGTPAGTRLAVDVEPGAVGSGPSQLVVFQDRLYFRAAAGGLGDEWWSTDGTQAGTRLLADLYPGAGSSSPEEPVVVGDLLYFSATDGTHGRELWSTGGTQVTTTLAADVLPGASSGDPQELTSLDDRLVYSAIEREGVRKPWVTVPAVFGAQRLDSGPANQDLGVRDFARIGAKVVFVAADLDRGAEVWVTAGTPADAQVVKDVYPGQLGSAPQELTPVGGRAVFQATAPGLGAEVWATDGTPSGTLLVHDVAPAGNSSSDPAGFSVLGDQVLFAANDGAHGSELWSTAGVPGTTRLVADSYPGPASGLDGWLGWRPPAAAGRLVFPGIDAAGVEPWTTDGRAAGTRRLADLAPGVGPSYPTAVGAIGNRVVLGAFSGSAWALYAWTAMGSTTTVQAKKQYGEKKARRKKIVLPVRVADESGLPLTGGIVTLTRKGKVIGRATLTGGRSKVRIRVRLEAGKRYAVVASWAGNTSATGSTSAVVRFKVKKARDARPR